MGAVDAPPKVEPDAHLQEMLGAHALGCPTGYPATAFSGGCFVRWVASIGAKCCAARSTKPAANRPYITRGRRQGAITSGADKSPRTCNRKRCSKGACKMCGVHIPTTGGRELQPTRYTEPELTLLLERLKLVLPDQPPPNYRRPGRRAPPKVPTFNGRRQHLQRVDHRRPVEWPTSANALSCSILILPTSARRAAQINVRRLPTRPPFSATRPMLRRRAARRRAVRSNRRSP
jgi:hypothetical protein